MSEQFLHMLLVYATLGKALATNSKSQFYKAKASKALNGREAIVPMGGILGGGSSINFMMYTRAQGVDFDSWNTPGWGSKDMQVMSNKVETFHQDEYGINKTNHGHKGPIQVSDGGYRGKSEMQFMDTIESMGLKEIVDLQDFDQVDGFSVSRQLSDYIYAAKLHPEMAKIRL
jgi:alcohol oxidase